MEGQKKKATVSYETEIMVQSAITEIKRQKGQKAETYIKKATRTRNQSKERTNIYKLKRNRN